MVCCGMCVMQVFKPARKQKNHSPVGLCRMKNRKGLSTMNQGGDDLAMRIAAMEKRSAVLPAQVQASDCTPRCWCLSAATFGLFPTLVCYHGLNAHHLLITGLGFSQ